MFALMVALAVCFALTCLNNLLNIAEGKPVTHKPSYYIHVFAINATLLAFVLYALLNWL